MSPLHDMRVPAPLPPSAGSAQPTPRTVRFSEGVTGRVQGGARFCALLAAPQEDATRLVAVLSDGGSLVQEEVGVPRDLPWYPSLSHEVPAAAWYERAIYDLHGVEALGHSRLDPLVVARDPDVPLSAHVRGEGVFTIPYGPVRSGVFETVEYLVETAGEDIAHIRTRLHYKHRGIEARFAGLDVADGVLLAERIEGVASVAHAMAFCSAVEQLGGAEIPRGADLVRLVHAELERIANHLDTIVRHTEAAGQAVAAACFSHHKERIQRLRSELCGSRFGRGVVVPGGVAGSTRRRAGEVRSIVAALRHAIDADVRRLMETPSFVDRLRTTGVLSERTAGLLAVVGPVGRGSAQHEDVRMARPYGAYRWARPEPVLARDSGDALARHHVRLEEITGSFVLICLAVDELESLGWPGAARALVDVRTLSGSALSSVEAPQGELLSIVEIQGGRLVHVNQRSASFHNLAAFTAAFPKEVFTDVAFVEASFGLSMAGAAG